MKGFELVEIRGLSGMECRIYSVCMEGDEATVFEKFVEDNIEVYRDELVDIYNRLRFIGNESGAREQYFKLNEGRPGDMVAALYDCPDKRLRLYCIRLSKVVLILGGGGRKLVRAWQDDETLKTEAELMMSISERIYRAMREKELWIDDEQGLCGTKCFFDDED